MTPADPAAERVARNDAIFREANERISGAAQEYAFSEPVPFICECAEPGCTEIVRVSLSEYEEIRSVPIRFINARGHAAVAGRHAEVVERRDGYDVVEKRGDAADAVEKLDTRSA